MGEALGSVSATNKQNKKQEGKKEERKRENDTGCI